MEKAKKVRVGSTPKASSHNRLADRVNDLISSGAGDPAWRIFYYAHSMFRQPRNPHVGIFNALGMWPSGDEWWTFFAHYELPLFKDGYARVGQSWPQVPAGYPEGANVVNPICKFTFGHRIYKGFWWGAIGLWSEGNNFGTHLIGVSPGLYTNSHFWNQAKTQRGAMFISGKSNAQISSSIRDCVNARIPRSAANRIVERRINVSSSVFAVARRPYDQILSQGLLYQLYAPAVVKGFKIWKRGTSDQHMSNYYKTYKAARESSWGWYADRNATRSSRDRIFDRVAMVTPVLHRKYASQQVLQSIFHYIITFRGSEHQRALFCRKIEPYSFETAIFDITTSRDYQYNNYPFLKKISTGGEPISVCDVGFNFQDFLSRQYILAPAYGEGEITGDVDYPRLKTVLKKGMDQTNVRVIKIDKEGYPRIRGSYGDATPTYHLDKSFRDGNGALKIKAGATIAMTKDKDDFKNNKNRFNLVSNRSPSQSGPVFKTNPYSKDRNAFCFAGYYIYFIGVTNKDFQCRVIIRKLTAGKWKEVEEVKINNRTSYFVQTNLAKAGATDDRREYNIYSKLNYFRKGLKGEFDFLLMPYYEGGTMIDFGVYDQKELEHFSEIRIRIEVAHLFDMRPTILDAYAFLRVATTKGAADSAIAGGGDFFERPGNPDNVGHDYEEARVISNNYAKFGSAINPHGAQVVPKAQLYLNNNPVYEATRKFVTSNMKMVPRNNVVNYSEERGKGVLYLDRFASGQANTGIDMFRGMGPAIDSAGWFDKYYFESGKSPHVTYVPIMPGKLYYVWSYEKEHKGSVVYNGNQYEHGNKFVGKIGVDYLSKKNGTTKIGAYELEGIRKQTPSGFDSNEWVMFMTFNPYHWSETNIWKTSIFGDQTCFLHNRCLFQAPDIEGNFKAAGGINNLFRAQTAEASMMRDTFYNFNTRSHLGIGDMSTYVQAPPKFNTWKGYNAAMSAENLSSEEALGWTESCKLVTNMYKITSITRFFGSRGKVGDPRVNLIRVELDRKLDNGKNPSISIGRGPYNGSYCDVTKVMEEQKYRSDKNGLVEYINSGRGGHGYQCGTKSYERRNGVMIGDYGANLNLAEDVGSKSGGYSIYGSCHPRFYFLKLIPRVSGNKVNSNGELIGTGAQLRIDPYVQMEYYIRAMHGGYIDEKGDTQFMSFLPGTDVSNASLMQSSVDHDMDSLANSVDNNPDVVTTDAGPEDITPSSRG